MKLFRVLFLLLPIVNCFPTGDSKESTTPITTCCFKDHSYQLGSGKCDLTNSRWPLLKVSAQRQQVLANVTVNFVECPAGTPAANSIDFNFFDNGSIQVEDRLVQANEFCINPTEDGVWVARHCVDSCKEKVCINKCCPKGMAMNTASNKCQLLSNAEFDIKHLIKDNYAVRQGVVPKCKNGLFLLSPATNQEDEFLISSADGKLYQPGLIDSLTNDYCLESFVDGNKSNLNALVCFPSIEARLLDDEWDDDVIQPV